MSTPWSDPKHDVMGDIAAAVERANLEPFPRHYLNAWEPGDQLWHKDNVPWWDARLPRRWHRCKAQTCGWVRGLYVQRCACGAIGDGVGTWLDRNSRRKEK